jgi:hypothetical protein
LASHIPVFLFVPHIAATAESMEENIPSRPLQRRLLVGLSGLALTAILLPLVSPIQPSLPLLPRVRSLPGNWEARSSPSQSLSIPAAGPRRFHPLGAKVALGPSQFFVRPDGTWLRLTPFASWTRSRFTLEKASESSPKLNEVNETSCLSRNGRVGRSQLDDLIGWNDKPLTRLQRYWHVIVPVANRSYSCLLVTSNASDLFDKSPASSKLFSYLTDLATWPDPPGLNRRQSSAN